ncbi:Crp/Fnr family transcriptional regulator [Pararhodobacter marinus]|uniref:Crp/Fnr family transcriptional regulator n=1 Tax=Pararhodobacter marinus TaxID=2184063 RepID=UPI003517DFC6
MIHQGHFSLLSEADLLRGVEPEPRKALLAECPVSSYHESTPLLVQGEPARGCYIVVRGRVEISYVDPQGNAVILHVATTGEVVGEVEALSDRPCAASCTALANTTVIYCSAEALLRHVPPRILIRNLAAILHERLARDNQLRTIGQFYPAEQRVCLYLNQFTTPDHPETHLSQAYLATLVGCSRQRVNRILGVLRRDGIIAMERNTIRVLDRARLVEQAQA